ncbi:YciI family protein [Thauera sinica]|uniref:YciI family protein n=1 Tax=Thauera sinica TaxID=2665146 RepID=A0ABW1AQ41_9RHOO|nr:YciI family protein [Thauera sp. K11]ATE59515.1 dehydrogenase [Thauera sp. K11]
MTFMLLIVEPRGQRAERSESEARGLYAQMQAFGDELKAQGCYIASESLRPDEHAVRVAAPAGTPQLRDGPFAEAKEMVGGFFLIEAASREEAVAIASRCPAARWATVEVRECAPCHVR